MQGEKLFENPEIGRTHFGEIGQRQRWTNSTIWRILSNLSKFSIAEVDYSGCEQFRMCLFLGEIPVRVLQVSNRQRQSLEE